MPKKKTLRQEFFFSSLFAFLRILHTLQVKSRMKKALTKNFVDAENEREKRRKKNSHFAMLVSASGLAVSLQLSLLLRSGLIPTPLGSFFFFFFWQSQTTTMYA
eukprot:TRINITY_DN15314_c1_g2_i1.p1 TRINITY_DN15314_c1_g2~~TRINITY_DN15314_c1_g2_i1.p1  ORF type:complete len:104 (+),score=0.07 TRINITY_DN15314_c1_g2_i1:146-457(+)